ncbi:MAG TPA: response regulator transcription factor [Bacillota bacterium]|nr:response regulator transcription factor [Bacillota bacterium]
MPKKLPTSRLVLVDDHALVREGLAEAIKREPDLAICGEAETALEARQIIELTRPDLVIVDLALRKSDGLDLIKDLHLQHPDLLMLVVSMHDEALFAERALRNGARGYITKHEASHTVLQAIRRVLAGEIYLSEEMAAQIAAQVVGQSRPSKGLAVEALSDRELQVFRLIGQGRSSREIAAELHLDPSTIDTYRARLKEKLGLESTSELLRSAIAWTHGSTSA